jgi:hypothetical protein
MRIEGPPSKNCRALRDLQFNKRIIPLVPAIRHVVTGVVLGC